MKHIRNFCRVAVAAAVVLTLAACDKKPFEKAGKAVDRALEKTGDKIKEVWRE